VQVATSRKRYDPTNMFKLLQVPSKRTSTSHVLTAAIIVALKISKVSMIKTFDLYNELNTAFVSGYIRLLDFTPDHGKPRPIYHNSSALKIWHDIKAKM
jgi:hypothetical protein